jgi:hypothetical protein
MLEQELPPGRTIRRMQERYGGAAFPLRARQRRVQLYAPAPDNYLLVGHISSKHSIEPLA